MIGFCGGYPSFRLGIFLRPQFFRGYSLQTNNNCCLLTKELYIYYVTQDGDGGVYATIENSGFLYDFSVT